MERLYPDLGQSPSSRLNLSSAFTTAGFTTVNDKVLMEMNLRAQRQLEEAAKTPPKKNLFSVPCTQSNHSPHRTRSPGFTRSPGSTRSPGWGRRFSQLHGRQFARMDSIETHPSVSRAQASQTRHPVLSKPAEDKRQGALLESPSKRRRMVAQNSQTPAYEPIQAAPVYRPTLQTNSFRSRTQRPLNSSTPAAAPAAAPNRLVKSHTSAHLCADKLPSYARPTQAALRKSQSSRALATRSESTLNQLPGKPQHNDAKRLMGQLGSAPRSLNTRPRQ